MNLIKYTKGFLRPSVVCTMTSFTGCLLVVYYIVIKISQKKRIFGFGKIFSAKLEMFPVKNLYFGKF